MTRERPERAEEGYERQSVRYPATFLLYYSGKKMFGYAYTRNISDGGCFVETAEPEEPGSAFGVELFLDLGIVALPMQAEARVAWANTDAKSAKLGMGIQFISVSPAAEENLARAIEFVSSPQLPVAQPTESS